MKDKSTNILLRIAVSVVAIPLILFLIYRGGWWWLVFVELLVFLATIEIKQVYRRRGHDVQWWSYLQLALIPPVLFHFHLWSWFAPWIFVVFFLGAFFNTRHAKPLSEEADYFELMVLVIYIGMGFGSFVTIRHFGLDLEGARWLFFMFGVIWLTDSAALFAGSRWGKLPFSPEVSPNKTWIGFWAGIAGGLAVGVAFVLLDWLPTSPLRLILFSAALAGIGQLGDLFESLIKRRFDVKDMSSIIPGHGGVLDRFDSALFAAPLLYILLRIFVYGFV